MTKYSFEDIKDAYTQKRKWEKQFPINFFLVRPLSFRLTYVVLGLTHNPARIAVFGFIIGILGCLALICLSFCSIWPGLFLIFCYSLLDAVDGNVARTTNNVTLFGKYLDGLLGDLIDGSYPFFLGIGLYISGDALQHNYIVSLSDAHATVLPLFLGAFILISRLWAKLFQAGHEAYRVKKEGRAPAGESELKKPTGTSRHSDRWYYLLFLNVDCLNNQLLLLTILALLGFEIYFLIFLSFFFLVKAVFYFFYYYSKTKSLLIT